MAYLEFVDTWMMAASYNIGLVTYRVESEANISDAPVRGMSTHMDRLNTIETGAYWPCWLDDFITFMVLPESMIQVGDTAPIL